MSSPPPPLPTPLVLNDSSQSSLEEKKKDIPVAISANHIDLVTVDGASSGGRPPLSSIRRDEPIVTRRELWSYYCQSSFPLERRCGFFSKILSKCTTTEIMYADSSYFPDHLGSNFVQLKGVGPNGYTMTLFQSLADAAGYDPVRGPGSSCNTSNASAQCVLPWGGGTMAVASVVLIANGVSFAVGFHSTQILFQCLTVTAVARPWL